MNLDELMKSEDLTREYDVQDINNNKLMAVLAYFGILVLVPIFTARQSKFAMFHAEQAIPISICVFVLGMLAVILGLIPAVGFVFAIIIGLVDLIFFVLAIIGIVNAASGQAKILPLTGKFRLIKLQ